ncbi:MAG: hypothetical protein RL275_272 [Chloroflexota bacterium]
MTHPEIIVSWVSLFLRANGARIGAEYADLFNPFPRKSLLVRVPN